MQNFRIRTAVFLNSAALYIEFLECVAWKSRYPYATFVESAVQLSSCVLPCRTRDFMADSVPLAVLIDQSRQGNAAARNALCEWMRPKIEVLASGQFPGALAAKFGESDLVQEVLLGMSQNIESFDGQGEQELLLWVRGIVENKSLEMQRRFLGVSKRNMTREQPLAGSNSSQPGAVLTDSSFSPLEKLVAAEDGARIRRIISELPIHYQKVLELRFHENLPFGEIGRLMGRTEPSVKNLFVRAMELVEKALADR